MLARKRHLKGAAPQSQERACARQHAAGAGDSSNAASKEQDSQLKASSLTRAAQEQAPKPGKAREKVTGNEVGGKLGVALCGTVDRIRRGIQGA